MNTNTLEEWENEGQEPCTISVEQMDEAVKELKVLRIRHSEAKAVEKEARERLEEQERFVMKLLASSNKKSYIVDGVGRVTLTERLSVTTPKTPEEKQQFFDWVKKNLGEDVHDAYMTVNSRSLNTLYKELSEEYAQRGEVLNIPGLSAPTSQTILQFRA